MKTENKVALMQQRLSEAFNPHILEVLDESHLHAGHAGFNDTGSHFAIRISAPSLTSLSRVEAHRKIYDLFTDLIPNQIHALRITIVK